MNNEWKDGLPPVGEICEHTDYINDFENPCDFKDGDLVEIIAIKSDKETDTKGVVFIRHDKPDGISCGWTANPRHFKPIDKRTPREKAIYVLNFWFPLRDKLGSDIDKINSFLDAVIAGDIPNIKWDGGLDSE